MSFKKCTKCTCLLPIEDFWPEPRNKSGFQSWCKECKKYAVRLTKRELKADKWTNKGNRTLGEARYNAKLTEDGVRLIRALVDAGLKDREIAEKFDDGIQISPTNVASVRRRDTWAHI